MRFCCKGSSSTRVRKTPWSTAVSNSSAGFIPWLAQARSEMKSHNVTLGRPLGSFPCMWPAGLDSPIFPGTFWVTWPNQDNWDLSTRRSGSTFKALRFSQLCTLSQSFTPWTFRKNAIFAACIWNSTLSDISQDSWPYCRLGSVVKMKVNKFSNISILFQLLFTFSLF